MKKTTTDLWYAINYESITVADSVKEFSRSKYESAKGSRPDGALITAETADMRFRFDGIDPTASEGHLMQDGDIKYLWGHDQIKRFRIIRSGAVSGTIRVTYFRIPKE